MVGEFFFIADIIGIASAALSGYIIGADRKLDPFGVAVCAFATALGGGIVRDTIADVPPFAFTKFYPFLCVTAVLILAFIFKLHKRGEIEQSTLFVAADAVGLAAFAIAGSILAIRAEFNIFGVLMLGFIGAVGGGVIRDVLVNEMPTFMFSDFYATVALICALLVYLVHIFWGIDYTALLLIALFCVALRIYAYKHRWRLERVE